jgi:hypothetical protein
MLGPNPKKAATPSAANSFPSSSGSDSPGNTGDGLMVKAIDDIFRHVEAAENPQEFRVSFVISLFNVSLTSQASIIYSELGGSVTNKIT